MYGTNPFYNPSFYGQINPMQNQQPAINQTFQLSPSNSSIRYAKDIDDVRKSLVLTDTLFVDKDFNHLWFKNTSGNIKTYSLEEITEQDEKDKKIAELEAKIKSLEKEMIKYEPTANASTKDAIATNKQP